MNRTAVLICLLCAAISRPGAAQHDHAAVAAGPPPAAAMLRRDIRALPDTQVAQYRRGEGMGLALAAELNHYPGPRHALELADSLHLTAAQRAMISAIRERMGADARLVGETIIERERELDRAFAGGTITEAELQALTADIARLQGALRFTHLRAHLEVRAALTDGQVRRYDELRGYAGGAPAGRQ